MAMCRRLCLPTNSIVKNINFSTSYSVSNKWRRQLGLEPDPRQFGPLTNFRDYSFLDGRPTILSSRKLRKLEYQKDICKRIVQLCDELDTGLKLYNEEQEKKQAAREAILKSKLKEKGAKLLTRKNNSPKSES